MNWYDDYHDVVFQSTLSMRRATSLRHTSRIRSSRFQSTLSMRRATDAVCIAPEDDEISIHALHEESDAFVVHVVEQRLISIHALHEESDSYTSRDYHTRAISIHALHEESDICRANADRLLYAFQSTLSMRRATWIPLFGVKESNISIHALHEESDAEDYAGYPQEYEFQSTLSMRRATVQLDIFVRFLRRKPAA